MREAARIYSKKKKHNETSSIFKSTIGRDGCHIERDLQKLPGPGAYEVSLPMVKPKYEAIVKKNRSIIIKVNDVQMPGFNSREPRFFRQYATIQDEDLRNKNNQFELSNQDREIYGKPKNAYRYNFSMARKKSQDMITNTYFLNRSNEEETEEERNVKAPKWSKYREQRKIWNSNTINIKNYGPGPGSYEPVETNTKNFQSSKVNSWQFRSQTKRPIPSLSKSFNFRLDVQNTEGEQKMKSIHSRHNLLAD